METQEDEIEKKHHLLLEKFLEKGDINSFKKMLNIQANLKQKPKHSDNTLLASYLFFIINTITSS